MRLLSRSPFVAVTLAPITFGSAFPQSASNVEVQLIRQGFPIVQTVTTIKTILRSSAAHVAHA
jgi:hypothetical protein